MKYNYRKKKPSTVCTNCHQEKTQDDIFFINSRPVCSECMKRTFKKLEKSRESKEDIDINLIAGWFGACISAIMAGILYGLITISLDWEFHFLALFVGIIVGYAALLAAGKKRSKTLQLLAAIATHLGMLVAKYISFAHLYKNALREKVMGKIRMAVEQFNPEIIPEPTKELDAINKISILSYDMISRFFSSVSEWLSTGDIIWIFLAALAAYGIPAIIKVRIKTIGKRLIVKKIDDSIEI